jgi:hypothetical protein
MLCEKRKKERKKERNVPPGITLQISVKQEPTERQMNKIKANQMKIKN